MINNSSEKSILIALLADNLGEKFSVYGSHFDISGLFTLIGLNWVCLCFSLFDLDITEYRIRNLYGHDVRVGVGYEIYIY